nr:MULTISPECIES: DUF262 domain-containing protein [Streptomyces]
MPAFQGNRKWDDDRIRANIATVTLDYPLGLVMTLQTGGAARFRSRTLTGAGPEDDPKAELLLLYGQQRLTSSSQHRGWTPRWKRRTPAASPSSAGLTRHREGSRTVRRS